jgi:hypothetical protein
MSCLVSLAYFASLDAGQEPQKVFVVRLRSIWFLRVELGRVSECNVASEIRSLCG